MRQALIEVFVVLVLVLFAAGCGGGGGGSPLPEESIPVAVAGTDQQVLTNSVVILNGSQSSDPGGALLTFSWSFESMPEESQAELSDPAAVKPSFTPDREGVYVVALVVSNGEKESLKDLVTINAARANAPPTAHAGPDQNVTAVSIVTLDGTGSSDADEDVLTFSWSFLSRPAGSAAALSDGAAGKPTFVADTAGEYVLQLIVNDGSTDSAPDTVTITAASGNSAPVADAGNDRNVVVGALVNLDGSGSHDADGDELAYFWTLVSRPAGSEATLSDASSPTPSILADRKGDYVLHLFVNDGLIDSLPAAVTVTAMEPVADAGTDQAVKRGDLVTLDGTGSSAADPDNLTYSWSLVSKPEGSTAVLSGSATANPTFTADVRGEYLAQLVVSDGFSFSSPAQVTVKTSLVKWVSEECEWITHGPDLGPRDRIYVVGGYSVCSFNSDGSLKFDRWTGLYGQKRRPLTPVGVADNGDIFVGYEDGTLRALDQDLYGNDEWVFTTGVGSFSEIAAHDVVNFGSGDVLYSLDHKVTFYKVLWTYQAAGEVGSPAVGPDGTVYFGAGDNLIYAVDSEGVLAWSIPTSGRIEKPVVGDDGRIYFTGFYSRNDKKELVALNPDGTLAWIYVADVWLSGVPSIGNDGTVYVTSSGSPGGLFAVRHDGSHGWFFPTDAESHTSPAMAADGSVIFGAGEVLYLVSTAGDEERRYTEIEGTITGSPRVGSDGTIFVAAKPNRLYALYGDE